MISILLAAHNGVAQEDFVVFEGVETSHYIDNHPGSSYDWKIFIDFSPDIEANISDFELLTPTDGSLVNVQWKRSGWFYLAVTETDMEGCSNFKVFPVHVIPNNRTISFEATSSSECYNNFGNDFSLTLILLNGDGLPLDSLLFPVDVQFVVNGVEIYQQLTYSKQELQIEENLFEIDLQQNSSISIEIVQAFDKKAQIIYPFNENEVHIRTIHSIPILDFSEIDEVVNEASFGNYSVELSVGEAQNALYNWNVDPPEGTGANLKTIKDDKAKIFWNGPAGSYNLSVFVVDGNGCNSNTISQLVKVEDLKAYAGPETVISSCSSYIFSDVYPINDSCTYSWKPATNLDNPNIPNPVFTPGKSTTYELTVTTSEGISARDSVTITVSELFADAGDDVYMEFGSTALLEGMESRGLGLQYSWTTQTGFIESGANSANPVISGFGTYYLEVTDVFNCSHLDSVEVIQLATILVVNDDYDTVSYQKEIKIPVMNNDISIDNSIDSTTLRITLQPINGVAYVDYDDYTIHYTPNLEFHGNDNFEYQICNKLYNCAHANVFVWVNDFEFLIPNAFSPNDDGINDYFEILGIDYFESNSITIINRSGIKVFETKNYGISSNPKFWDGKSNTGYRIGNEGLPSGTYFYVLRLGNGEMPISGSIYLDR